MTPRSVGRLVGVLLLVHFVCGLMLPYILMDPVIPLPQYRDDVVASPGFLQTAAASAAHIRGPVLLFLCGAVVMLGVSIASYAALRQSARGLALCVLALAIANIPLQAVESGLLLSMLSLSQRYTSAAAPDAAMVPVAFAVAWARLWIHFMQLLTAVSWIAAVFALLWRARQIPRALALFGIAAAALQISAVPLRALLGYSIRIDLGIPLAPAYIGLALWLMVKGFDQGRTAVRSVVAEAQ